MNGPPTRERRQLQELATQNLDGEVSSSSPDYQHDPTIRSYAEHFQFRVLQNALAEATADFWRRRAQEFLDARPRHGDSRGNATREDLQARYDELTEVAAACRAAAEVALLRDDAITADELAGFTVRGTS